MDSAVIEVLQQAGSQDPNVFKPAEQTLKQWETERGFYIALYNIFSNHSLTVNVRWMAIVCFKNGVDRYWKTNITNGIAADEKEFLRQHLIANFEEPVNQLAVQLAVLIAKIARYDCPREWGSLIPTLLDVIRGQNPLAQHRALLTLHHVVKSLASKRLSADRRLFQELTTNVFNFILNLWNTYTESFLIMASNGADTSQIQEPLEKALLLLRILRKLTVNGFNKPSESQDARLFLESVIERIRTCIECRKTLISRDIQMEVCDKFIIHMTKVLMEVLEIHPYCYLELIPRTLEFSIFYCFTDDGQALVFERFVIQCFKLIKGILSSRSYRPVSYEPDYHLTLRADELRQKIFTPEILTQICSKLVSHYFLLTPADLQLWDSDPEEFVIDDGGRESWKYSLRPCTEYLFQVLYHHFRKVFTSVLVELMQRHHQPVDPNDLHAILLKDAVYNAVGLAASDLYDEVNFDQWFSTTLKEELKIQSNNYRIIRRRVCWLIGRWTSVKLSAELRPELYKLMVEAFSPEEDLCVRLAASDALKCAIDDFQFNPEDFFPYLEPAFFLLFSLLKEAKECDTKIRVLYVISCMIERIGSRIKPCVGAISSYLQVLWQQFEEHNMLRCAIVATLIHLERVLRSESIGLEPFVVGVVALSCDVNQESHAYLLEGGLDLWLALLENTPTLTPAIMDLYKNMPELLELSMEKLRMYMSIIEAYVLLSPQEFLSQKAPALLETLWSLVRDSQPDGIITVMTVFETIIRVSPQEGAELIKPYLPGILEYVYNNREMTVVTVVFLCILARLLLCSRDIFVQGIRKFAKTIGEGKVVEDTVLGQIIYVWVSRMSNMSQRGKQKLLALALCSLLEPNSPPSVLEHFPKIISNIVETLNDLSKIDSIGCANDLLLFNDQVNVSYYDDVDYETELGQRRKRLDFNDPVYNISLRDALQNQLLTLRRLIGENQFNQLMSTLDSETDEQLKEHVTL